MKRLFACLPVLCVLCIACNKSPEPEKISEGPLVRYDISNLNITCFEEDSEGYMWIGTFRGLNRYNGKTFYLYQNSAYEKSIPDNQIRDIMRDSRGRMWVATISGVCLYTEQDDFLRIPMEGDDLNVLNIAEDKDGRIFAVTSDAFHLFYDGINAFRKVAPLKADIHGLPNSLYTTPHAIYSVSGRHIRRFDSRTMKVTDSTDIGSFVNSSDMGQDGSIWMSTEDGLKRFSTLTDKWVSLPQSLWAHQNASYKMIYSDPLTGIFFCRADNRLLLFRNRDEAVVESGSVEFPIVAPDMDIVKMLRDSQGNLWMGSQYKGFKVDYSNKDIFTPPHTINSIVLDVFKDAKYGLWTITQDDKLYLTPHGTRDIISIDLSPLGEKPLSISQLFIDNSGRMWFLSKTLGFVWECSFDGRRLQLMKRHDGFKPMCITEDSDGGIWIGDSSQSLHYLRRGQREFSALQLFTDYAFIPDILRTSNDEILVAAFGHLPVVVNPRTLEFRNLEVSHESWKAVLPRALFIPTCLYEDSKGDILIGTISNGLLRYSPSTREIASMPGCSCDDITAIIEDKARRLWVSTLYGLSMYDPMEQRFTNYYAADGLGGNQFSERAVCMTQSGRLVFGGSHGVSIFDPTAISRRSNARLRFEYLKLHNSSVHPGEESPLKKRLSLTDRVMLDYRHNSVSISYSALDYSDFDRIRYSYMMSCTDGYWVDAGHSTEAVYSNLCPGNHKFSLRAYNNDMGELLGETSLSIRVRPPWWFSWWAISLMAAFLLTGFVLARHFSTVRHRLRQSEERARLEKEQEARLNKMNMDFFANISHELRTPLTMISGPISLLSQRDYIKDEDMALIKAAGANSRRMFRLVNQILEFNKLENDTLRLSLSRRDIISSLREQHELYASSADIKQIRFTLRGVEDSFMMWLDEDKLDKITGNLISNALKHTPKGGSVELAFDVVGPAEATALFPGYALPEGVNEFVLVKVSDTGEGVPQESLEKIFDRYYQVRSGKINYVPGSGIGLYYSRALARLHKGWIKGENRSDVESGCVFSLILPVSETLWSESDKGMAPEQNIMIPAVEMVPTIVESEEDKRPCVLIVDDDADMDYFLQSLLKPYWRVSVRFDAESALERILNKAPDLVVSDIAMPGMSGYELCRRLKEDIQLCHIPVILVTAKTTLENQVEGLESGADAYVTKPFDPNYLIALIKSILRNRETLRGMLSSNTAVEAEEISSALSPQDKLFMDKLYALMESELDNSELDISNFTTTLGTSRTKFYYKVKGLTGESPGNFFKTYKLNRAAQLLKDGRYNISEVADMTGFSSLSHFSSSFKKQFGVAPSAYIK